MSAGPPLLDARIDETPLERAAVEVAVAHLFETDRPLRGAAGRADWRLCGQLSALVAAGHLTGRRRDALLVPTRGRLQAPRLLLLGLGRPEQFGPEALRAAGEEAVERLLALRVRSAALALPGAWVGALPVRAAIESFTRGGLEALGRVGGRLRLELLVPEGGGVRAARGLDATEAAARGAGVVLRVAAASAGPASPPSRRPAAPVSPGERRP